MAKITKFKDITELHLQPSGFHLLVLPDPVDDEFDEETEDELKTAGGLVIPKTKDSNVQISREREQAAQVYGTLVAVGPLAWADFDRFASNEGWYKWAKVGDRIAFARYSAKFINDPVTKIKYALINDRDLTAVIV